jgi:hypothetical protein
MATSSDALPGWFRGRKQRPSSEPDQPPAAETPAGDVASGATTGGGLDQEPVVVWEAANRMEAEIVAGRLQSEGIPAMMQGEALGAIYGLTTGSLAATVVLVPAPLAAKALEILATDVEWDDTTADADRGPQPT